MAIKKCFDEFLWHAFRRERRQRFIILSPLFDLRTFELFIIFTDEHLITFDFCLWGFLLTQLFWKVFSYLPLDFNSNLYPW